MHPINPFAALTHEIAQKVLDDHQLKRQAEKRLDALMAGYREMIEDPRYKAIRQELMLTFGEQVRHLVETAQQCPRCAPHANRIALLKEFIAAPLETVLFEESVDEATPPLTEGEPEDA